MMTSEKICNELGEKFFCKAYVHQDLKYFKTSENRVELCDGLFSFANIYIVLQIKEKTSSAKADKQWLNDIVYCDAVNQIIVIVDAIKNDNIKVKDLYQQTVEIDKRNIIFPVIIFDNPSIKDYKRILRPKRGIKINVFSMTDYKAMLETLVHPYDIAYYLQERFSLLGKTNATIPFLVLGENVSSTILSRGGTEESFASFFTHYIYDGKKNKREDALRLLAIINTFRDRQIKKSAEYKHILGILQMIEPKIATAFMEWFKFAWGNSCNGIVDWSKAIMLVAREIRKKPQKISIVFYSAGNGELKNYATPEVYFALCEAKQQQHETDIVLLIVFKGESATEFQIDWQYFENKYRKDPELIAFYKEKGLIAE